MNKILLEKTSLNKSNRLPLNKLFLLLLFALVSLVGRAQCIGPYQTFESFKTVPATWTLTPASSGVGSFASSSNVQARSGGFLLAQSLSNTSVTAATYPSIISPAIVNPKTVSFYINKSAATTVAMTYVFQYSPDNGTNWYTILSGTNSINGVSITGVIPTIPNSPALSGWYLVSATFNTNNSLANYKFRISDTRAAGTSGSLWVDDFSATTYTVTNSVIPTVNDNVIVVPSAGASTSCNVTVPPAGDVSYSFYDLGGLNDIYNKSQTQTFVFAPTNAGEKVQLIFNSFNVDTSTKIYVYDDNVGTTAFSGFAGVGSVTNGTTLTATNAGGYITVKFVTLAVAPLDGFNITVKCVAPPTITSLGASSGCDGGSLVINGTNLTGATAANVTIGATPVLSAVVSGGGTVLTVVPANGSSGTVSVTTPGGTVNSALSYVSNPLPTISGTASACIGNTTQLTGSATAAASNPWVSSNTGVATVNTTGLVTGVAAGSTTITYTNTNGCAITAPVTINALPTITGTLSACIGSTTQLTGSATAAAITPWVSSNTAVATVDGTGLVTGVAAGTSTITYTNSNGCSNTALVTINALPTISGTVSACVGSTTQLIGSGTAAASNPWVSSNAAVATVNTTGLVTGVSAGSATITYTNTNGCAITASVTINALPTITGTLSACIGSTTQLTGSATAAASNPWVSSNTAVATVSATGLVTGVTAGATTITYTNTNGCSITASATINALPTITGTLSACIGSTTQLSGSATAATVTPWVSSNTGVATVDGTGLVTGISAGSATITYTNTNGCANTALVTINALPTITGTLSACTGNTTQLTGSGTAAITNPWVSSNTAVATINSTGLVTGVSAGSTTITYTTSNGCAITASVTITTTAIPTIGAGTAITNSSFTANWSAASGATGYYLDVSTSNTFATFLTGYNGLSVGNVTTYSISGLTSGTTYYYRVRATGACGITTYSGTTTVTTTAITYCTPTYSSGDTGFGDQITNVTLGTLNNSTGASASPYYTFYNAVTVPNLYRGSTATISVTMGTDSRQYIGVWIDFNQNGTFETSEGFVSTNNAGASGTATLTITIPAGAVLGNTRMRVRGGDDNAMTTAMACGATNSSYGETEDYTVNIIPIPPCSAALPSALTASFITATTAVISWTDSLLTPNSVYEYYVSTSSSAPSNASGTVIGTTVNGITTVNLSGLTLGLTYYVWVRSNCGSGVFSNWVGSTSFTTVSLDVVVLNGTTTGGTTTTCNAKFYDSGNATGNYSNNESYTYTFVPGTAGTKLKAVFNSFTVENSYDFLSVYNGTTVTPANLIGTYTGTQIAAGQVFFSTAPGGELTFKFTSDFSVTYSGWDVSLSCVTLPTITSFTPTSACAGATTVVTITGTNLAGVTSVSFNGVAATPTSTNATTVVVNMPATATTGLITVNTATASASSASIFTVKPIPATPNAGPDVAICSGGNTTLNATTSITNQVLLNSNCSTLSGWTSNDSNRWLESPTNNAGGTSGELDFNWFASGTTNSYIYLNQIINTTGYTAVNLSFKNMVSWFSSNFNLYVETSPDLVTWTTQWNITPTASVAASTVNVNLASLNGTSFYIRFRFNGDAFNINDWFIDDVTITGQPSITYAWTTNATLSATNIYNPVATPTTTQTYTVATVLNGCSSLTDDVIVTVNPRPTAVISGSQALCSAGTVPISIALTGTAPWNLTYTNGTTPVTVTGIATTPYTFTTPSISTTTTYTVTALSDAKCTANAGDMTGSAIITVGAAGPTMTSTFAVNALCASTSAQSASLNYSATTNTPTSYSIDWNAAANTAGFADQTTTTLAFVAGSGSITGITIPANIAANQYTGSLTITNAGGCSSSYTITANIGKLWNGTTSNDWGYANNWTPSGVPTSSDCVVIPAGTPNSPEISVNAFAGNLTINATASLSVDAGVAVEVQDFVKTNGTFTMNSSASLVQINNVANSGTGNMVYKRDVSSVHGYDYIYWSSPVAAQAISGLYSTPGIGYQYYWDTLANNNNGASGNTGQGNWSPAYGAMQVGKGYIVRGSSSYNWSGNLTANFTGIPNNGDLLMSIARGSYTGAPYTGANGVTISNQEDNYNLIGNPYPSAIKATDFLNWPSNTTKIQGVVYLWTHNSTPTSNANTFYSTGNYNYFTNDYLAYNNVGASSGPGFNGYIAAGQGFFVTMLDGAADTTQSVTFNNSMRNKTYANTNFFKGTQQATQASNEVDRIWLDLVDNNNTSTRTLIGYIDGATVNKDRQFDAYTPVGNNNIIYSLVEGDSHVIQGRPLPFDANDQVPLGYHSVTQGSFTIAIATLDGLFAQGQPIYLEDKVLNVIYDLRQAPYVFTTAVGTFNDRFVLRYTNSNLSNEQFATHSVAAFINNQKLEIKASSLITTVQLYDVTGKLIKTYTPAVKALELIEDFPFANGVYFAKIKLDDGSQYIQKLMN